MTNNFKFLYRYILKYFRDKKLSEIENFNNNSIIKRIFYLDNKNNANNRIAIEVLPKITTETINIAIFINKSKNKYIMYKLDTTIKLPLINFLLAHIISAYKSIILKERRDIC